eukprot:Skav202905  [mRNA]  locus=scaffold3908:104145:105488:- [translate_table: standard]
MSAVNATVTSRDQATADNVDIICAMLLSFMTGLEDAGIKSGILARSFDLSSAYKQLCVATSSRAYSYIAVYNPETKRADVFSQVCLPFGSKAAVNAFIRCSRCIQWIAAKCLLVPATCYYDDFVIATTPRMQNNSEATMSVLFDLLGWKYDKEGPKSDTFNQTVMTLGVIIDLQSTTTGVITVSNTTKRKLDVIALIDGVLDCGSLSYRDGQVLRGKLAFAHGQVFGLSGRYALQQVSDHVHRNPFSCKIGDSLRMALSFLKDKFVAAVPRRITKAARHTSFILTDASFDHEKSGGLGGVLCNPDGTVCSWFQLPLTTDEVAYFMRKDQEVAIAELETLAVVIAAFVWGDRIAQQHVVICLDNDVARFGLVKGYSKADGVTGLVRIAAERFELDMSMPWFLRVPSASNLADFPSRSMHHPLLTHALMVSHDMVRMCLVDVFSKFTAP